MLQPVFLFDGACGFCRRWITRWKARVGRAALFLPGGRIVRKSSRLIEPAGRTFDGADAVFRLFNRAPGLRLVGLIGLAPGIRHAARMVYAFIARHRNAAARVDRWLLGDRRAVPSTTLVRWLFLRCLGLIFLSAFISLRRQLPGLYGRRGIQPLRPALEATRARAGSKVLIALPSLLWWGASDRRMAELLKAGEYASASLALNVAPRLSLFTAWAAYLSFVSVGGSFLSFQWDTLLLETGASALLIAPGGLLPGIGRGRPSSAGTWLMRWLAFRLHFESGIAKLQSGDETWRSGTACGVYYETAPLPTRLGWRAHQLPRWMQQVSTAAALVLECIVPWLALLPRRPRRWAFGLLMFLQSAIFATGNYGFFNLLSAADLLWLLDDEDLWPAWAREQPPTFESLPHRVFAAAGSAFLFVLSRRALRARLFGRDLGRRTAAVFRRVAPFALVNQYGLFSVMTTSRPEIVVEGSRDGIVWEPYAFRFKPGDPKRPPQLIAPHMPRLDWLMWFAAMTRPPAWFGAFLDRLLDGGREVLDLLASNPFADRPPAYVRASLYDYRMTDMETRCRTGEWWRRERLGTYFPPIGRHAPNELWA